MGNKISQCTTSDPIDHKELRISPSKNQIAIQSPYSTGVTSRLRECERIINKPMIFKKPMIIFNSRDVQSLLKLRKNGQKKLLKLILTKETSTRRYSEVRGPQMRAKVLTGLSSHSRTRPLSNLTAEAADSHEDELTSISTSVASYSRAAQLSVNIFMVPGQLRFFSPASSLMKKLTKPKHVSMYIYPHGMDLGRPDPKIEHSFCLYRNLRRYGSLESLSLRFGRMKNLEALFRCIRLSVSRMHSLSDLTLHIDNSDHQNPLPEELCLLISGFNQLSKLDLSIHCICDLQGHENNVVKLYNSIASLKSLSNLTLKVYEPHLIKRISQLLQDLPGVSSLTLNLTITDHLSDIISCLKQHKSLRSISLELSFDYIPLSISMNGHARVISRLKDLIKLLKGLTPLKNLTLDFGYSEAVREFFKVLSKDLSFVKHLTVPSVQIKTDEKLDSAVVSSMTIVLPRLTQLTALIINGFSYEDTNDEETCKLAQSLKACSALTSLTMDFSACRKVGNKTISGLSSTLTSLIALRSLHLELYGCRKLSRDVQNAFVSSLLKLENLSSLNLRLTCDTHPEKYENEKKIKQQLREMMLAETKICFEVM